MNFSQADKIFMGRALQLAELGGVEVAPNPMVGAVIVVDNKIIGEGYHQNFGAAHAEVNAVNSVSDKSVLKRATIYVSLEPCSHFGKTPPCADLIVEHQFKRVVIACQDTFSEVSGEGIERIRNAEIQVDIGLLEEEAREVNKRFFTYHEKKRPYVILKWAQTKDGFMDRHPEDRSKGVNWITQPETKLFVHKWRSEEQAIMAGWKTVANDNPQLNVRSVAGKSPHRFVIDPGCNSPVDSKVFTDGNKTTVLVKQNRFKNLPNNVEVAELENINPESVLEVVYSKQFLSVFIEGGPSTLKRFIQSDLWDEARVIEGDIYFKAGLEAPKINLQPTQTLKIGKDTLYYFNT
jgi:diaminohydroxyphosphoribosylaminopyrimidine deaminase/5-amino-6-(5-phosphoribosylamino)uracil reductase